MNIPETYSYLVRARRDLWAALDGVPNDVLSRPLLSGSEFHCIKDIIFHIAAVQDGWIHEDILREPPVLQTIPDLKDTQGGPAYADFALSALLDYWKKVEERVVTYLATLTDSELIRIVIPHDAPTDRFTVDGLLWHVMIHEMRHTAQIVLLLRIQGITPPSLDLYFYLPRP
jgi:uncharacterized damage-inducible protein DinB